MNRQSSNSNRETNQDLQEQELACLTSLLKEEEFQQMTPASGQLYIFPLLDPPMELLAIDQEKLQVTLEHLRKRQVVECSIDTKINGPGDLPDITLSGSSPCRVQHLPSLEILFWFPENYPSEAPPNIQLSCPWMEQKTLDFLDNVVKQLWEKNGKLAVLYDAFLHLSSITSNRDLFPLGNILLLIPPGVGDGDVALTTEGGANSLPVTDPSDAMELLLLYNSQRAELIFRREQHQCPVCFVTRPGPEFISLRNCRDYCCIQCMKEACTVHISEGTWRLIRCLVCAGEIHPLDVGSCVSRELFDKYQRMQLDTALACMRDIAYCPRPSCSEPVIVEGNVGRCRCGYFFCTLCNGSSHGDVPCPGSEGRNVLPEQNRPAVLDRLNSEEEYLRSRLHDMLSRNKKYVVDIKHCPGCLRPAQKISGCDHMTCSICNVRFCWRCLQRLDGHISDDCRDEAVDRAADEMIREILPKPELWFDEEHMEHHVNLIADKVVETHLSALPASFTRVSKRSTGKPPSDL